MPRSFVVRNRRTHLQILRAQGSHSWPHRPFALVRVGRNRFRFEALERERLERKPGPHLRWAPFLPEPQRPHAANLHCRRPERCAPSRERLRSPPRPSIPANGRRHYASGCSRLRSARAQEPHSWPMDRSHPEHQLRRRERRRPRRRAASRASEPEFWHLGLPSRVEIWLCPAFSGLVAHEAARIPRSR